MKFRNIKSKKSEILFSDQLQEKIWNSFVENPEK